MPLFPPQHLHRLVDLAKRGRVAPLYLFIGNLEESQGKAQAIWEVLKGQGALLRSFDLRQDPLPEMISALAEGSLFGPRLVILARGGEILEEKEEASKEIQTILSRGQASLFLMAEKFSEGQILYRFALEYGVVVPLPKKGPGRLLDEIPEILSRYGKNMEREVAVYFLSLVGEDYLRFRNELEKLMHYTGDRRQITREDVEAVVCPEEEAALFLLGDVLLEKGAEAAWRVFQKLLETGEAWPRILAALATFFKRLWTLEYVRRKHPELFKISKFEGFQKHISQAIKEIWPERPPYILDTHPYALFRLRRHLWRINPEELPLVLKMLWELDTSIKRGLRSPERAFYEFFIRVERSLRS